MVVATRAEILAYDEDWLDFIEPAMSNDPGAAQSLIDLLFVLKEAIDQGDGRVKLASETLMDGIRIAYLYTDAHRVALELFLLSLTGHLKPQDEPVQLISDAIERGKAEIKKGNDRLGRQTKRSQTFGLRRA